MPNINPSALLAHVTGPKSTTPAPLKSVSAAEDAPVAEDTLTKAPATLNPGLTPLSAGLPTPATHGLSLQSVALPPAPRLEPVETKSGAEEFISVVSPERATALFAQLKARGDIPFLYHEDGCFARAHQMAQALDDEGITVAKVFVHGNLRIRSPYSASRNAYSGELVDPGYIFWRYHVAVALWVDSGDDKTLMVLDPSICGEPVSVEAWTARQTEVPGSSAGAPYCTSRFVYNFRDSQKKLDGYKDSDQKHVENNTRHTLHVHKNRVRKTGYLVSDAQRGRNNALMEAVVSNNLNNVKEAIAAGADMQGVYGEGAQDHLLNTAIQRSSPEVINTLLDAGATAETSLLTAVEDDKLEVVKDLLRRGLGSLDYSHMWNGETPLINAVHNRKIEILDEILDACSPADINHRNHRGETALFYAVAPPRNFTTPTEASLQLTRRLIKAGAEVNITSPKGKSPLSIVQHYEDIQERATHRNAATFLKVIHQIKAELLDA